jgi:hypothetical protein
MSDPKPTTDEMDILFAMDPRNDGPSWGPAQRRQLAWHLAKCADFCEVAMGIWAMHGTGGRFENLRRLRDLMGHALKVLSRFRVPTRAEVEEGGP